MVLAIGEILVDVFISEDEKVVIPGGAPFNVASNILSFGTEASFYGAVGNDEYGRMLIDFVNSKPFVHPYIDVKNDRATTQALVTLENGERTFKFIRENGADDDLDLSVITHLNYSNTNIIHFGSLILSSERGRIFVKHAVEFYRTKYPNVLLSFDVNYRDDIFDSKEDAIVIFKQFIRLFDIVKLSHDEVKVITGLDDEEEGLGNLISASQHVFLTLGERGSKYYHNGRLYYSFSFPLKPVDTTGAGDAFYSYLLANMDYLRFEKLSKEEIEEILLKANCVGALATQKKGAIDVVPNEQELQNFINKQKNNKGDLYEKK